MPFSHMPISNFAKLFLRQSIYALAFFVTITLVAEFLAPDSVAPFVDPLPFAVLALAGLAADAFGRQLNNPSRTSRLVLGVALSFGLLLMLSSVIAKSSGSDLAAVAILGGAFILIAVLLSVPEPPGPETVEKR